MRQMAPSIDTHPEYPLEKMCVHVLESERAAFARNARHLLNVAACELELEARDDGLLMRGETEAELEHATTILNNFYGSQIQLGPLVVRYHNGKTLEQPYMGIRIRCDARDWNSVKADLIGRGGSIVTSEHIRGAAFIRAVAPLANLIGYGRALAQMAGPDARHVMWLSHYAPCDSTEDAPPESLPRVHIERLRPVTAFVRESQRF